MHHDALRESLISREHCHDVGTLYAARNDLVRAHGAEVGAPGGDHLQNRNARATAQNFDVEPALFVGAALARRVETAELGLGHPVQSELHVLRRFRVAAG